MKYFIYIYTIINKKHLKLQDYLKFTIIFFIEWGCYTNNSNNKNNNSVKNALNIDDINNLDDDDAINNYIFDNNPSSGNHDNVDPSKVGGDGTINNKKREYSTIEWSGFSAF